MICFRADIPRFPLTVFSVFNCFRWTMADAGHAVGTVLSPDRLPIFKTDIVQRTDPDAFSTEDEKPPIFVDSATGSTNKDVTDEMVRRVMGLK